MTRRDKLRAAALEAVAEVMPPAVAHVRLTLTVQSAEPVVLDLAAEGDALEVDYEPPALEADDELTALEAGPAVSECPTPAEVDDEPPALEMDDEDEPPQAPHEPATSPLQPRLEAEWRLRLVLSNGAVSVHRLDNEAEARAAAASIEARGNGRCVVERRLCAPWEPADRAVRAGQGRD